MDAEAESGRPVKPEPGHATTTAILATTAPETITTTTTTATATADISSPSTPPSTSAASSPSDRCVICLDAVAEPCLAQPCGHRHFDFLCLISWLLQRNPSCPLCKAVVTTVQYGDDLAKTFPVPVPVPTQDVQDRSRAAASESVSVGTSSSSAAPSRPRPFRRQRPPPSSPSPAASLERRRRVYRLGLYARHVGANRHSRYYRELTPQLFAQDPDLVSRARAFLRRELHVFWEGDGSHEGDNRSRTMTRPMSRPGSRPARRANNVEFLLEYIVAILQSIDLQDSAGQAEELLQGFFHGRRDHTRHFLHELRSFLRSPYLTLASWDRHVQYGPPSRFPGEDGEGVEEAGVEEDSVKHSPRPMTHGVYWGPSRRRRGSGSRAAGSSSSMSRLRLEEACRRFDPS